MVILHKTAGKTPDWGKDPLQFATEVFRLRDKLAHGKPQRVVGPIFSEAGKATLFLQNDSLQPDWYRGITKEWVMQAKERFRILMIYLAGLFGFNESDHLLVSTGGLLVDDGRDA